MNKLKTSLIAASFTACLILPAAAQGRDNNFIGELSVRQSFDSNVFNTDIDPISEMTTDIAPSLNFSTLGKSDSLSFTYTPTLTQNHRLEEYEAVHDFNITADKELSGKLQARFTNDYKFSNNSPREVLGNGVINNIEMRFLRTEPNYQEEIVRILFPEITWSEAELANVLSQFQQRYNDATPAERNEVDTLLAPAAGTAFDNTRRRHWTNTSSFTMDYQLGKDSEITGGYTYKMLDDDTANLNENEIHSADLGATFRLNPQWSAESTYEYTHSNYDRSADSEAHNSTFRINLEPAATTLLYADYSNQNLVYEDNETDQTRQNGELGWQQELSKTTNLNAAIGGHFLEKRTGGIPNERGYDLNLGISHQLKQGTLSLDGQFDRVDSNRTGKWDDYRQSHSINGDFTYEIAKGLDTSAYATYGKRYFWAANRVKSAYDDYGAGLKVSYLFMRWFTVTCGVDYTSLNTTNTRVEDYNEHIVYIELAAVREFLHL